MLMSSDIKEILRRIAEEDYESEKQEIDGRLDRCKSLILEIAKVKRFDLAISVEGSDTQFQKDEKDLNFLERGNLVKGKTSYTRHNAYREYQLTKKGDELATKLLNEKSSAST